MKDGAVTREELMDLSGIGVYDEQLPSFRGERSTYHHWSSAGKQAHMATASCWCGPTLIHDDSENEIYQHREFH